MVRYQFLMLFMLLMAHSFKGNPTMSAVASVVTVNIVIFLYIVTAIRQDSQGDIKSAKKD